VRRPTGAGVARVGGLWDKVMHWFKGNF